MWPSHPGFEDEFHADIPSRLPRLAVRNEWPDRLLLLDLAARPVSVNFQPRYKCTAKDLLSCITTPPPNMRPPLCPRKAVHHLSRFLNPRHKRSDEYLDARRRLNKAITKARETGDFDPRLAIKAFKDLDTIFFAGKLTGNTRVSWAGRREMKRRHGDPDEMCLGMTEYLGDGTAWIVLSSYTILVLKPDPFMTMWETLLHEMVHAFFYVKCGNNPDNPRDIAKGPDWCEGHGTEFRQIIRLVDSRAEDHFDLSAMSPVEGYDEEEEPLRSRGMDIYGYGCGSGPRRGPHRHGPAY